MAQEASTEGFVTVLGRRSHAKKSEAIEAHLDRAVEVAKGRTVTVSYKCVVACNPFSYM